MSFNDTDCTVYCNSNYVPSTRLEKPPSGLDTSEVKGLAAVNTAASIVGAVGNLLVCFVVTKFRFLGRPKAELFIASLAVADLLVCVFAQPMYVLFLYDLLPTQLNMIRTAVTWISTLVSVSHLFTIAVERFLSLYFLYRHSFFIRDHTIWKSIVFTWLLAVSFGAPASTLRKARHIAQYYVIAVLLIMPVLYAGLFYIVRLQQQRIRKQIPAKKLSNSQKSFTKERRTLHKIAVVVGAFYVCITPLIVLPFFFSVAASPAVVKNAKRAFPWVNTVALCNSSLNPYDYYWRSWQFRLVIDKILRRIIEKK